MCFETTKSARAKIAKTDIVCWKVLRLDNTPIYECRNPPYIKGKINPNVKIKKVIDFGEYSINEGYHSFKEKKVPRGYMIAREQFRNYPQCLKKFIIPAGTRYFENETEYVSETIMLVK